MTMERKNFAAFVTKVEEDKGIVEAIVAVFGNIDLGNDVIHKGAFTKTMVDRMGKIRVLDNHRTDSVLAAVGTLLLAKEVGKEGLPNELKSEHPEATGGLFTRTQYLIDTPEGLGVFKRIKANAISEYSIGYDALDYDHSKVRSGNKSITVRNLRTLKWYEFSPVLFGMNDATITVGTKEAVGGAVSTPEEKTVNYSKIVEAVSSAFSAAYNAPNSMMSYYVQEVLDTYCTVCCYMIGGEAEHYQVTYTMGADGGVQFAPRVEWIEGDYVFVPDGGGSEAAEGEMSTLSKALKAGRVLNARNAARIGRIMQELQEVMKDAGLYSDEEDKPDKPKPSDEEAKTQAGPGADTSATPPTSEQDTSLALADLKTMIDLELEQIEMSVQDAVAISNGGIFQ